MAAILLPFNTGVIIECGWDFCALARIPIQVYGLITLGSADLTRCALVRELLILIGMASFLTGFSSFSSTRLKFSPAFLKYPGPSMSIEMLSPLLVLAYLSLASSGPLPEALW